MTLNQVEWSVSFNLAKENNISLIVLEKNVENTSVSSQNTDINIPLQHIELILSEINVSNVFVQLCLIIPCNKALYWAASTGCQVQTLKDVYLHLFQMAFKMSCDFMAQGWVFFRH